MATNMHEPTTITTTTHVLVIPYPAQGHMIPLLDMTHHLAATTTTTHLTITVVTTPKNLPLLNPLISTSPNITPLVLPFPPTPGIPAGAENTKDLPPSCFRHLIPALSLLEDPLRLCFESHPSPPVVVVSNMLCGWAQGFAAKMGIKGVVFSPSGAMALSVIYALWSDMPKGGDKNGVVSFRGLPNCPKYRWWQLSPVYRSYVEGDADSELIRKGIRANMFSWGLVIRDGSGAGPGGSRPASAPTGAGTGLALAGAGLGRVKKPDPPRGAGRVAVLDKISPAPSPPRNAPPCLVALPCMMCVGPESNTGSTPSGSSLGGVISLVEKK